MNVLAFVMDEASAFKTKTGGDNADKIYGTLRSSAQSRFGFMHWMGFIISFPRRQEGDFTVNKYKRAIALRTVNEETGETLWPAGFADHGATWDIHPRWEKGHPMYQPLSDQWVVIEDLNLRVPKEFEEDFLRDGTLARTQLMADPPPTEGGFFENPQAIDEAVNPDLPKLITTPGTRTEMLPNGKSRRYIRHEIEQLPPVVVGMRYGAHGDPGLKKDSFSIALAYSTSESKTINVGPGETVEVPKVVVPLIISWDPRANRPVDLLNQEEVMMKLAKFYNVRRFTFDRWNSAHSIQKLVAFGIDAEDMAFSNAQQYAMYRFLRLLIYNRMIELPDDPELINELKFLRDNNGKIEHDVYGKDRADAVATAVWNAAGKEYSRVRAMVQRTLSGFG